MINITLSPTQRTRNEIANILGIHPKTLKRRLDESDINLKPRVLLSIADQEKILYHFNRKVQWSEPNQ